MIPTLFVISLVSFAIIILPPGDVLDSYLARLYRSGGSVTPEVMQQMEVLRDQYGLNDSFLTQYGLWLRNIFRGNFGYSFLLAKPVVEIVWERMAMTLAVTVSSLLLTWIIAFPIGIYSAVRQHCFGDYIFTFLGFLGLSIPGFLFARVLMYFSFTVLGVNVGGLFSNEYLTAAWSWGKFVDLLRHLWLPAIVVGLGATAGMIRVLRNNLLDELNKPYVMTARAKGLTEMRLILKYPVRIALNPFLSTVGFVLPTLVSGSAIASVVLDLPTAGRTLLDALLAQDMYLGGALIMLTSALTVVGVLLSDLLLALVDPRIRYTAQKGGE